jgi:hypothetical protein
MLPAPTPLGLPYVLHQVPTVLLQPMPTPLTSSLSLHYILHQVPTVLLLPAPTPLSLPFVENKLFAMTLQPEFLWQDPESSPTIDARARCIFAQTRPTEYRNS